MQKLQKRGSLIEFPVTTPKPPISSSYKLSIFVTNALLGVVFYLLPSLPFNWNLSLRANAPATKFLFSSSMPYNLAS